MRMKSIRSSSPQRVPAEVPGSGSQLESTLGTSGAITEPKMKTAKSSTGDASARNLRGIGLVGLNPCRCRAEVWTNVSRVMSRVLKGDSIGW
jgi:hypothetical protein